MTHLDFVSSAPELRQAAHMAAALSSSLGEILSLGVDSPLSATGTYGVLFEQVASALTPAGQDLLRTQVQAAASDMSAQDIFLSARLLAQFAELALNARRIAVAESANDLAIAAMERKVSISSVDDLVSEAVPVPAADLSQGMYL